MADGAESSTPAAVTVPENVKPSDVEIGQCDPHLDRLTAAHPDRLTAAASHKALEKDDDTKIDPEAEPGSRDSPQEKAQKLDVDLTGTSFYPVDEPQEENAGEEEKSKDVTDPPSRSSLDSESGVYHVKWVGWNNALTPIVTQNENGPCPLLSIVNVLLLRGKLRLPEGCDVVSADQLLEYLGDVIIDSVPREMSDARRLDYEQNVHDAIAILPKLQTGLDVNVRFTGVADFEYTPECIIFDLLNISLYHGWLMDPQQTEVSGAVGSLTYNQLVDRIITDKSSQDSVQVSRSLVAQQFLEESASQLTYHGLSELISNIKEEELAVFFRNNHFSAIYKEKAELFLLVTDQGFLKEPRVVWETLSNIDGDCHFVDEKFVTVSPASEIAPAGAAGSVINCDSPHLTSEQQIDQDHQLAMTLASGEDRLSWREGEQLTDEELAKKLQEEENPAAAAATEATAVSRSQGGSGQSPSRIQQQVPSPMTAVAVPSSGSQRNKNCVIL